MANENSATGSRSPADRDRSYGGGYNSAGRSIGSDRPQRTAHTDFITPKYGWGDATMRDFSIIGGGIGGIYNTFASGNTYAGRTPQGFASQGLGGNNERPGMGYGGPGDAAYYMSLGFNPIRARIMAQGRMMGGTTQQQIREREQALAQAAQQPAPAPVQSAPPVMLSAGPMQLSVPGPSAYGLMMPGYQWLPGMTG